VSLKRGNVANGLRPVGPTVPEFNLATAARVGGVVVAFSIVLTAAAMSGHRGLATLAVFATAIAVGEIMWMAVDEDIALPTSFAMFPVVAVAAGAGAFAATVTVGSIVGVMLVATRTYNRAVTIMERLLAAAVAFAAFHIVLGAFVHRNAVGPMIVALAASELGIFVVDECVRAMRGQRSSLEARQGLLAWLALGSSGVLMALGYRGTDGHGAYGLSGVALFATPLIAAVYSFERLHAITRISRQTIDALAAAPELGGLSTIGHAQRVATTTSDISRILGLSHAQIDALDTAARLHHLGVVTLPADAIATSSYEDVAEMTGEMLRGIDALAAARAIIEGDTGLPSAVLRVANKYDHITGGNDRRGVMAVAALRSGADDVYDVVVVEALARVVARRVELQTV
jgi:hypothetical protein